jgi:hypothetical protein
MNPVAAVLPLAMLSMAILPNTNAATCEATDCLLLALNTPAGTLYIDDRGAAEDGVWLYLESNHVTNLQRGGCSTLVTSDCESAEWTSAGVAAGDYAPDTLLI